MVPQYKSRAKILLPSLFNSPAQSNNTQWAKPQSTLPSPGQRTSHSTALIVPSQDARGSLSRPIRFQKNQYVSKKKRKESHSPRHKAVRRPRFNPYLHYKLSNTFYSSEIVFWDA